MAIPDVVEEAAKAERSRSRGLSESVQDYYRQLLAQLPWPTGRPDVLVPRSIGLTSCYSGEGTTTLASHLATTASANGRRRVLLVDANSVAPALHRMFGVARAPGLAEVLGGDAEVLDAVRDSGVPGVSVLPAGVCEAGLEAAADWSAVSSLVGTLADKYDLVVWDLPSAQRAVWTANLAALLDGLILVVEADRVRWEVAQRHCELLARAGVRLLGAVLNKGPRRNKLID